MINITRQVLDAGWGGEPSTIRNILSEVMINRITCKDIGKAPSYPPVDPHPVKDLLQMVPVVDSLIQSLDYGRLRKFSQLMP